MGAKDNDPDLSGSKDVRLEALSWTGFGFCIVLFVHPSGLSGVSLDLFILGLQQTNE